MLFYLLSFNNKNLLIRALTNKIHEHEYYQKSNQAYFYGNNEDLTVSGQQFLEFYFYDYLLLQGYPNPLSFFKKPNDIIQLRQRLINDQNLAEIGYKLNLQTIIKVGNQNHLKSNQKILADTIKALVISQYYDKNQDLESLRDILHPVMDFLISKIEQKQIIESKNNPKSNFQEYINKIRENIEVLPKLTIEQTKNEKVNDQKVFLISLELEIKNKMNSENQYLVIQKRGISKRITEQQTYLQALQDLRYWEQTQSNNQIQQVRLKQQDSYPVATVSNKNVKYINTIDNKCQEQLNNDDIQKDFNDKLTQLLIQIGEKVEFQEISKIQ